MTVAAVTPRISYDGDGANTYFTYPFKIIETTDIEVWITDSGGNRNQISSGFNVDTDNARVVYPYPPLSGPILPVGSSIELVRSEPYTQELNLTAEGTFNAEVIELALDKLTMIDQQLNDRVDELVLSASADILDGSITTNKLANLAVTAQKIANLTITADQIASATITAAKIELLTITAAQIANATITSTQIASATILGSNIAVATITGANIGIGTISGSNIGTGAITASNIATGTITATQIASQTIVADNIANLTITTNKIGLLQITNALINDLDASKINAGLLSVSRLNILGIIMQNFIWTDHSPSGAYVSWSGGTLVYAGVTRSIAAGNTNNKYIYWQLSAPTVFQSSNSFPSLGNDDFLISTNIAGVHDLAFNNSSAAQSIVGSGIADRTITATNIVAGTITGNEIANATIAAVNIANATITATQIANATITAAQIANGTITATQIASATITASQIANLTITAAQIANLAIGSGQISSITADKITTGTLNANLVTIASTDGKMTLSGNIFQVKDASDVIQVTIGKYNGTNYGFAAGLDPGNPNVLLSSAGLQIYGVGYMQFHGGATIYLYSSGDSKYSVVRNVLGAVSLITQSSDYWTCDGSFYFTGLTKFMEVQGTVGLCTSNGTVNYQGGDRIIYLGNRNAAPTGNPTAGGFMYAESGALKWRGSSGTVTTIANA